MYKFTEKQEKEIIEFYLTPNSLRETSQYFNISNRNLIKKILKKYNVSLHASNVYRKIQVNKSKKTNLKKYGVEFPAQNKIIKEKGLNILKEKYGGIGLNSTSIKEKVRQTNIQKYGVENPFQSEKVKEKSKQTCLSKYGCEYITQSSKYKTHAKKVLFERYGVYHAPSYKFAYNNEYFDSFPELCFYMYYLKNHIDIIREPISLDYLYNDKICHYYPDFKVNNQLYEIKGDWCLTKEGKWRNPFDESLSAQMEAKHQCALDNNIIILYEKDYQKYIDWFNESGYKKEDFLYKKDV